jgi:hypothetical protein
MVLERFRYPYTPGVKGIPPEEFLLPSNEESQDFIGGSGRRIRRHAGPNSLIFVELEPEHQFKRNLVMRADLKSGGELNFDLRIRLVDDEGRRHKHQDFYGVDFLHVVIGHVFKGKIHSIRGGWFRDSINYTQFRGFLEQGMSNVDAANATWTGLIVEEHDFRVRDDFDIPNLDYKVEAMFLPEGR